MVRKLMYRIAEKKMYEYQCLLCQIEAYEQDHGGAKKRDLNGFIKAKGRTSDPTGAESISSVDEPVSITEARKWVWAIEAALESHEQSDAERGAECGRAYLMREWYAMRRLNTTAVNNGMARRLQILDAMCISETTLRAWKREIVESVIQGAIQAGVLKAY